MKKELVIELEEECLVCPHLSLVTRQDRLYADGKPWLSIKVHECEHLGFCMAVRAVWETVREEKDEESRKGGA